MVKKKDNFYITTTLPYVNAKPHIGFALEIIQADVIARWQKMQGKEVFFNTGTDEHGLKIYRKAEEENKDIQDYVDEYADKFKKLMPALGISDDVHFIRTTDKHHVKAVQEFWKRCDQNGDIYKKNYKIKYCVGCELEKTESELKDGKCSVHPNLDLETIEEENYFFKFSKYQDKLLDLYKNNPDFVKPGWRLKEIRNFVADGLEDFSISRLKEKMPWGVPVPGDDKHVMYVWFDALINYISTLQWPSEDGNYKNFWPGMQVAGKDNLRQQAAMWQAMLLSAKLPTSTQIFIHGFITSGGQKMSKSLGNVIDPFEIADKYGIDALRYYLLAEITPFEDGDFTIEKFEARYNADLANGLGNLVNRVTALVEKFLDGKIGEEIKLPKPPGISEIEIDMNNFQFNEVLAKIWKIIDNQDQIIQHNILWDLGKTDIENFRKYCHTVLTNLLLIAKLIEPFMPETSKKLLEIIKAKQIKKSESLFPRI